MKSFMNKTAAITGAGSGIGAALAKRLAADGCHLALSDVNEAGLAATAADIRDRAPSCRVTTTHVDVANRSAVHAWADATADELGGVNLIFNNAGVALGSTVESADYADLEWIININLWGVIHGTKAFLPHLRASGSGHVINISSVFGLIGVPSQGAYNATKFAVRGFTEALRHENEGSGLHVMCVHPGGIRTAIARNARMAVDPAGATDQAASAAKFEKLARTTPEQAAEKILKDLARKSPRCLIGPDAKAIDWIQRVMPVGYGPLMRAALKRA